jgi:hypothetical protein
VSSAAQLRVQDLLDRLPGTVHRGRVPGGVEPGRLETGQREVDDLLGGGLPRGRLTEMVGVGSVGATSLAQKLLAEVTGGGHFAAWVDFADAFDPQSAQAAGAVLSRMLWVRPPDPAAALSSTEILLSTGGFDLVLLDAARLESVRRQGRVREGQRGVQHKGRRMLSAAQTWLRLDRAASRTRTSLVVLAGAGPQGQGDGLAGAAAGVRLRFSAVQPIWQGNPGAPYLLEGLDTQVDVVRERGVRFGGSRSRRTSLHLG